MFSYRMLFGATSARAVKQLMPGQDLTRVTIPAFFLEPRSLLERMADTQMHPDLLLNVSTLESPVDRMKAITKWWVAELRVVWCQQRV